MKADYNDVELLFKNDVAAFMAKYRNDMKEQIEEFEDWGGEITVSALYCYLYGVVVDWREYDDEIVRYFVNTLVDGDSMSVKLDDDSDPMALVITYNGVEHRLELSMSPADRYITIRKLRDILSTYEIKLFKESYMSDTHAFFIIPKAWWEKAVQEHGKPDIFMDITDKLDFP